MFGKSYFTLSYLNLSSQVEHHISRLEYSLCYKEGTPLLAKFSDFMCIQYQCLRHRSIHSLFVLILFGFYFIKVTVQILMFEIVVCFIEYIYLPSIDLTELR